MKTGERLLLAVAGALACLIVALLLWWSPEPPAMSVPRPAAPQGGDFTLVSADGPVSLAALRGKLVLVYFGYTYCPDICPTSLAATAEGLRRLSADELARVAVIFVSVDPERDTPARLKDYVAFFHPAIVGVTGTPAEIADVARRYGVSYAIQKAATAGGGYVVDHSADTYLVGPDGRLAGRIAHATPPEQVAAAIRQSLNPP